MKAAEIITTLTVNPETQTMNNIVKAGLSMGYSLAAWQLPGDDTITLLLTHEARPFRLNTPIENLESGFLFCPFNRSENGHYLKADFLFRFKNGKLETPQSPVETASIEWLSHQPPPAGTALFHLPSTEALTAQEQPDFKTLVSLCIQHISEGTCEKIVPSRFKAIPLPAGFDVVAAFRKLCAAHPAALVSLVSIPEAGTWLGASPEILVQVEGPVFRTVALAGTQPYVPDTNLKEVAWTQKEIEEQALVSRYIINCFKKIRLREFEEHGPKTAIAGNLLHLKTDFTVDMTATNFPQLASVMLNLLHPTSAVCGMPMEPALQFLQEHEGYDRAYYTGFLGPASSNQAIQVFVNLRCMQVTRQHLVCYAGCGVTADSDPQKEWEETQMKLNTLLTVVL